MRPSRMRTMIAAARGDFLGAESGARSSGALGIGRSVFLVPVRMNFCSSVAGAWGTVIFWKQVGQSICVPACDESHLMCWPHTGQAYLNSLIGYGNISQSWPDGNLLFKPILVVCLLGPHFVIRALWLSFSRYCKHCLIRGKRGSMKK